MGIEREQVFMKEVYEYPFAYDEGISSKVEAIQKKNSNLKMVLSRYKSRYQPARSDDIR